jgi:hypothetical protein
MNSDEPSCNKIDEIMQHVGVRYAIYRRIDSNEEEERASEVAETRADSRNHLSTRQCLDQEDEWHDREYIVV